MVRGNYPIILLAIFSLLMQGCISFRGHTLPRYRPSDLRHREGHTFTFDAEVITPVPRSFLRLGPDRGKQLGPLSETIESVSKEVGINMIQPQPPKPPDIHFTLYKFPDQVNSLGGQYYGYLAGITLTLFPYHEETDYLLVVQYMDDDGNEQTYEYRQEVHVWNQLLLLPFAFFTSIDEEEHLAVQDLVLNFLHDFEPEGTVKKSKAAEFLSR